MNQQPLADIVALAVLIAAAVFSRAVAEVVGPYLVIVVASAIGASFALARREKSTRGRALWFFTRVVGLAVLLTVGAAAGVSAVRPDLAPRTLLAPIALLIGFIGDGWPRLLARAVQMLYSLLDLARGQGGKDMP
jgi:apolipoprotein N-acyltransferase